MAKKMYVGNLPYGVTDNDLHNLFGQHGSVRSAQVIKDRDTGRSKGFGFVEMDNTDQAQAAIDALNGQEVNGRALTVNEARPVKTVAAKGPSLATGTVVVLVAAGATKPFPRL